jgi:hypothetical protein
VYSATSRRYDGTDRYTRIFRSARGHSSALNDTLSFEGPESFPQEFVFVFDLANKTGLQLSPWWCVASKAIAPSTSSSTSSRSTSPG